MASRWHEQVLVVVFPAGVVSVTLENAGWAPATWLRALTKVAVERPIGAVVQASDAPALRSR